VKTSTIVTLVELVGAVLYCWWLYSEITKSDNMTAELWYYIAKLFQNIAAYFGRLGLAAELEYHQAAESGRL
jgi:hypothetical protein